MAAASPPTLWEALALDEVRRPVVAIVGGGGKTSLLYALGGEAAARGVTAVLGGTTRFTRPDGAPPLVVMPGDATAELGAALVRHGVVVVTSGLEPQNRLGALSETQVAAVASLGHLGLLALEADGSRTRPFKAPGEREPVIPHEATHVVVLVGADAIDAPLDEAHVHRPERVRALLDTPRERTTVDVITRVLLHAEGGRRGVGGRRFVVLVNKADLYLERARELAEALLEGGAPRVVLTSFLTGADPVRALLTRD